MKTRFQYRSKEYSHLELLSKAVQRLILINVIQRVQLIRHQNLQPALQGQVVKANEL